MFSTFSQRSYSPGKLLERVRYGENGGAAFRTIFPLAVE